MSQYSPEGSQADLPDLRVGRYSHACAGYYDDQDHLILLVAGGLDDNDGVSTFDNLMSVYLTLLLILT